MKVYSTTDVCASVHKAHDAFTHVVLSTAQSLHMPKPFNSAPLVDLPLFQSAGWIPETARQVRKWKKEGGVLLDRSRRAPPECDVLVLLECPISDVRLELLAAPAVEYVVVPNPVGWTTHEDFIDLRYPVPEVLHAIWTVCAGKAMSVDQIAEAVDIPSTHVHHLKKALKPEEFWYIEKRIAPTNKYLLPAWNWLESGVFPVNQIGSSGFKSEIMSLGKTGYIDLKKMHHYPAEEPDWRYLKHEREAALREMAEVRLLVESSPDHLSL